jgi:hypothetical protein
MTEIYTSYDHCRAHDDSKVWEFVIDEECLRECCENECETIGC